MPRTTRVLFILTMPLLLEAQTTTPVPPVAPIVEHREVHHGVTLVANYYWLREKSNPQVIKYLDAENAYTEPLTKALKPLQHAPPKPPLRPIKHPQLTTPPPPDSPY